MRPAWGSATLRSSAACKITPRPTPGRSATGSSVSAPRERRVLGYGAASRAVALLCRAGVDQQLLPAIADSSSSKHGRRMPGTDIPIIDPARLATDPPDAVLLFVPDLLTEVRRDFPQVEESGGDGWTRTHCTPDGVSVRELRPPTQCRATASDAGPTPKDSDTV